MIKTNRAEYIRQAERAKRERQLAKARNSLLEFTKLTNPNFVAGWSHKIIAYYLEKYWRGEINLILSLPPRHSKSELASRNLPAWGFGHNPDFEIISCSYADSLASRMNRDCQRIIESEIYREIFPNTRIQDLRYKTDRETPLLDDDGEEIKVHGNHLKNNSVFQIVGRRGVYRSAGVGGGITGMGFERGLIDDPFKDAKEAKSATVRESVWEWYGSVFYNRRTPTGKVCVIMTRWHEDDLVGKLIENMKDDGADQYTVLNLPAICDNPNEVDPAVLEELGLEPRKIGDPLDGNRYNLSILNKIRLTMGERAWNALYQGKPSPDEGELFKVAQVKILQSIPPNITKWIRYWDKAGTEGGKGAQTAGALVGITSENWVVLADVISGRWAAPEREKIIRQTAELDGKNVEIWVEQEPGSGGKESAENTVRNLQGFTCKIEKVTGDKVTRAEPLSCQVEIGNFYVVEGAYLHGQEGFMQQVRMFPNGRLKDMIDATGGAYNKLTEKAISVAWA